MCILGTKQIINENYKIPSTNNTNVLPSQDKLLEIPLVSSTDDTLPNPGLLLYQESQFSTSNSITPFIHSSVTTVTPTLHSQGNPSPNK